MAIGAGPHSSSIPPRAISTNMILLGAENLLIRDLLTSRFET